MRCNKIIFFTGFVSLTILPCWYTYQSRKAYDERVSATAANSVRIVAHGLYAATDASLEYGSTAQAAVEKMSDPKQNAWLVRWQEWLQNLPQVNLLSLDQRSVEAREEFSRLAMDVKTTFPKSKEWQLAGIEMLSALESKPELLPPEHLKELQDFRTSWVSQMDSILSR